MTGWLVRKYAHTIKFNILEINTSLPLFDYLLSVEEEELIDQVRLRRVSGIFAIGKGEWADFMSAWDL